MGKMIHTEGPVPVLTLQGAFHGVKSGELVSKIRLISRKCEEIKLDIREVDFFDSGMLGSIVGQSLLLRKEGKKLTIILNNDPDSYVNALFEVSNLDIALDNIVRIDAGNAAP